MKYRYLLLLPLLFAAFVGPLLNAQPVRADNVTLELVSEFKGLVPGETNTVAVRLGMENHWHTYWANPGDSGLATQIQWNLPDGITAGPIQWTAPERIELSGLVSYAYEGEVLLLVDLAVADTFPKGSSVTLSARVDWLACKDACIPGSADLTLKLPIVDSLEPGPWKSRIDATRLELPQDIPGWGMRVVDNGESFALSILAPQGSSAEDRETTFFTLDGWVSNTGTRTSLAEGRLLTMVLPKAEYAPESDRFRGVLVSQRPWDADGQFKSLAVDLPFSDDAAVANWLAQYSGGSPPYSGDSASAQSIAASVSFGTALLFSFIGGLLLNLMPCVFPVLAIKILGFVQQAGEDKAKIKLHGLVFTVGVLVSFWILAGLFLVLRAAGQEIGWGFQLQTPGFVAVLATVLFLFGLNLSGVFEIGETLIGTGSQLQAKTGFTGSFFSGVLATVVATPCTAPFMGSALGIIVTLSATRSMIIFTALALGVALPYLMLSFFPGLLRWLPRPGAWMETFKKGLAFLLYASVVWLAWVFGNQVGVTGMAGLLLGLVVMGIAAWVWGTWGNLTKKKSVRFTALLAVIPVVVAGAWLELKAAALAAPEEAVLNSGSEGINWGKYDPELVSASIAEGKTVYADFTASWCLTCQVNKKVAFGNTDVIQYFKSHGIVALKGDWTRRDPVITRELQKFGRSGVPTNIVYRPDGSSQLLPEVLTPGAVLQALENGL